MRFRIDFGPRDWQAAPWVPITSTEVAIGRAVGRPSVICVRVGALSAKQPAHKSSCDRELYLSDGHVAGTAVRSTT